jgi:predicted Rossmann fold flavoprotein
MTLSAVRPFYDCIVIGGGASGFFTAIRLKEEAPQASVCILEAQSSTLGKVKISGGGRCNVTHILPETVETANIPKLLMGFYPRQYPQLLGHLFNWTPQQMRDWMATHGVHTKVEADGRAFPITNDSYSVVQLFESACEAWGIPIRTQARVLNIATRDEETGISFQHPDARFWLQLAGGGMLEAKNVVLATGGNANGYRLAEQLGLTLTPCVPSLFTFKVADDALTALAGVSLPWVKTKLQVTDAVKASLPKAFQKAIPKGGFQQEGALLVTHWGVSGPAVLKLSAWGAFALEASRYQATLVVDSLPALQDEEILTILREARTNSMGAKKQLINANPFEVLPKRWWGYLLEQAGVEATTPWQQLGEKQPLYALCEQLKRLKLPVTGKGVFKEEFVTAGGVAIEALQPNTLQAKTVEGCYVVGELLNVDGLTGGFNFQHCWASANAVAMALAETF